MALEDIQQTIAKLSPEDRAKLRLWLAKFEAAQAERREPQTTASKLGRLARRAHPSASSSDYSMRPRDVVSHL